MSDIKESPDLSANPGVQERPVSQSSVEPFLVVKVPRDANRDEVLGAVDRALTTRGFPFFESQATSGLRQAPSTLEHLSAGQEITSSPQGTTAGQAGDTAAASNSSDSGDNLLILVQKEGG